MPAARLDLVSKGVRRPALKVIRGIQPSRMGRRFSTTTLSDPSTIELSVPSDKPQKKENKPGQARETHAGRQER